VSREITRGKIPVEAISQTSCLIYVRREEKGRGIKRGSHNREEMAKWRVRASSERSETKSTGRLLNIIFSARENFSLFRSPTIVGITDAVVFSRGQTWEERRIPPFHRFRFYVPTACSRDARRAAPLLVLSFVNLDERSRLGLPPLFLFSSSLRCRRPSRCR